MNSKIPIFIISGKSPLGDPGGYPAYSHTLSHALFSIGHPVFTLAVGKEQSIEKGKFAEIHTLRSGLLRFIPVIKHLALAGLPYYSILFAREIVQIIKQKKIQYFILWGMGPWTFTGLVLRFFLPRDTKMIIFSSYFTSTRHEMKGALDAIRIKDYGILPKIRYFIVYELVARFFHIFEKLALDTSDVVIIHYESSRKIIQRYFGVPNKKIQKFPWYSEIFKRHGKNMTAKQFRHPLIVSICRQDPRKGINFIIRAIEILSRKFTNIRCEIVGTGSFLNLNIELVKRLRLSKYINFPGFVGDINPLLSEADIAIIVPLAQGSSALTVSEAMSHGKAIVGSNCDGIPEDITNNVSGLIVKKGDEVSLANALAKLIKNPSLRKKLGKNAYTKHKNRFGFDLMKKNIEELLSKYE